MAGFSDPTQRPRLRRAIWKVSSWLTSVMRWSQRRAISLSVVSGLLVFFAIPLVYVQLTVPAEYHLKGQDSLNGRSSRISDVAIIYNYRKEGRRVAVVQRPITYLLERDETNRIEYLQVTRGYKTDFASLPAAGRLFFSPFGRYAEAAIIHDWLYAIGEPGKKREADLLFYRIMINDGVNPIVARYFYTAVRLGTLFDGGGYGREGEWEDGFYWTKLAADYPLECIPEKPDTAWLSAREIFGAQVDDLQNLDDYRIQAVLGHIAGPTDPLQRDWLDALESPDCQTLIPDLILQRYFSQDNFRQAILRFGKDNQAAAVKAIDSVMDNMVLSEFGEMAQMRDRHMPLVQAYSAANHGLDLPDNLFCLSPEDKFLALEWVLVQQNTHWPEIACSTLTVPRKDQAESVGTPQEDSDQ